MHLNLAFTADLAMIRGPICLSRSLRQLLTHLIRIGCGVSRQEFHLLSNYAQSMSMVFGTESPRGEIGPEAADERVYAYLGWLVWQVKSVLRHSALLHERELLSLMRKVLR